ncbi:hypothetical protein OHB05_37930 [Streptomyces sp. NBC_00638]|uniref:WD40 repeat domain-containing protein n=1 Tax=unclassified Streptomyces TaxID=2593676 RepID=UPI0022582395|nr:hypothetical protein [Streptomyces sp. NBC_00638]MCX5008355.1 hypothetical protein [Streptomyces sp. NBC_00638]
MSPDNTWLVAVGRDNHIRIYDVAAQVVRQVILAPPEVGCHCAVAPDGSFMMTKSAGEDARAWDAAPGKEWIPYRERVQIRSTRTGEVLNTLELHAENIQECHMSPDRTYLLTMDREGTLIVWDAAAVVP